jgi:beta-RFAP synthase
MSEIVTGSRLHFGLFQPGPVSPGERRFGSAGMMIDRPGIRLRLTPASDWTAAGPLAERTLAFAQRVRERIRSDMGVSMAPHHLEVIKVAPEHAGLGTGTQLGMAVARLLTHAAGVSPLNAAELATLSGRGLRSAVGAYGFESGGFLVDRGRRQEDPLAPLMTRMEVPEKWRIVLALPPGDRGWHGSREQVAFDQLQEQETTARLTDLMQDLLTALAAADLLAFGETVHEFNRLTGEPFRAAQGGCYAGQQIAETISAFRVFGIEGTGQSSWGPAVFGIVADADQAALVSDQIKRKCALDSSAVLVAAPLNHGAVLL